MDTEQSAFYAKCVSMGETRIQRALSNRSWNERRTSWAKAWLDEQANSGENRRHSESVAAARSAAKAAWVSAIAAVLALIVAVLWVLRTV